MTETLISEVSALRRESHESTQQVLFESEQLVQHLPATLALLRAGDISYWHAQIMVVQSWKLPEELVAEFEAKVLQNARWLSVEQLRRRAVRVRERLNPESIVTRHQKALTERWVRLTDAADGMSYLEMYLSSDDAHAIKNRITGEARRLRRAAAGTDDTRTQAQFRTDIVTDLLREGVTASGLGHGVRATVHITVPAMTLMGHSDEPGLLDGVQPIDPETARRLAGTATGFTRLLVHPETGVVLSVGRDR
ncbi:DUF222 domain-containing protein, partial [Cryobacterium melibiosiphilum]|uniref:DUF222 domain-containing protein n=1 Tax=Cryobacterium melibiosiphilum TaxID=995039 RepID=UPI001F2A303C